MERELNNINMKTKTKSGVTPYTIRWWFWVYNQYSRRSFELSREYMRTSCEDTLKDYSQCHMMVNWIQERLCEKYEKYDFDEN